ncbi:MAG: discoidin domain-containing protein, partial [Clostridiales bacterium]|nr:discoidin domain-containing protein [Candidatus Coliplasma equi]
TLVIDLGKAYDVNSVRVHLWNANTSGITAAKKIQVSVSTDGKNFTKVGKLNLPSESDPAWAEGSFDAVSAQYVKVEITCGEGGVWTFFNEIEVYA